MRILVVVGTRPEAIKMLPLVLELKKHSQFEVLVCHSGQHGDMCDGVFEFFCIEPDIRLSAMRRGQSLGEMSIRLQNSFNELFDKQKFDLVLVHGDTTTAFCGALSAFYRGIRIGHVEAGLRTYKKEPFPEEFNRVAIDNMASVHFPPTEECVKNLAEEGIFHTQAVGNTVIDSFAYTLDEKYTSPIFENARNRKIILITTHRRENLGEKMKNALLGIRDILENRDDIYAVFPMHPNPTIRNIAREVFANTDNIELCEPLCVYDFHNILSRAFAVITDSGGIQEEAAYLGVPVFLLRDETERGEAVSEGNVYLVGTQREAVTQAFFQIMGDDAILLSMRRKSTVFGDGTTSEKIAKKLLSMAENNDIIN